MVLTMRICDYPLLNAQTTGSSLVQNQTFTEQSGASKPSCSPRCGVRVQRWPPRPGYRDEAGKGPTRLNPIWR
jgi:hypothetical protein